MRASGQSPKRGKGGKNRRPSTAGSAGGRSSRRNSRSGSPGTRIIGLDEFLEEGMSSVMPSPMKTLQRGNSGRSVVLLGALPLQSGGGSSHNNNNNSRTV